ncbi:L-aspartate oxidase [Bacillus xiamenensis]|uniref:L-aspartate oxidase n=1 Tax=Bacillus xiamenensis TaxID=1178537 RepID=UPI001A7E1C67|nr:L-aspartate oxidase [Bacillus xiamenensis]MBG9910981.1 L-aspartate oxidase [Bacillus xiamenensis]
MTGGEIVSSIKKVIVVGSGIAALSFANTISDNCQVIIMTKKQFSSSNSMLAQGGIAAAFSAHDSVDQHVQDTLAAGCDHNDDKTVEEIVRLGKNLVDQLVEEGCPFDRNEAGMPQLGKEGAHTFHRILHAGGDQTGKTVVQFLKGKLGSHIHVYENHHVIDLLIHEGTCIGVVWKDEEGHVHTMTADAVVLSTGGCGSLYEINTNDPSVTGDGLMMAYRAGAQLVDLEFVQFHPTLLTIAGKAVGLVSEAVRGEDAYLEDESGRRIMKGIHPLGDLAPRDVVARTIFHEQQLGHSIDLNIQDIPHFSARFPAIDAMCQRAGVDTASGRLPVSPGMHFLMGGIKVNEHGETTVPSLFAIGEAACTGLHGANRLASNSLLEGLVLGSKAARRIEQLAVHQETIPSLSIQEIWSVPAMSEAQLRQWMTAYAAIVRDEKGLQTLLHELEHVSFQQTNVKNITNEQIELSNQWALASCIAKSALLRTESRGGHYRKDYPKRHDALWQGKQIVHEQGQIHIIKNERIGAKWNVYS